MLRLFFLGAVALLLIQPADAGIVEYFAVDSDPSPAGTVPPGGNAETARNNFLAGLSGVGTENFEGLSPAFSPGPFGLTFPGSTGSITATLSGNGISLYNIGSAGAFATSPTQYLRASTSSAVGEFSIEFTNPIAAFGFYGTDLGDSGGGDVVLTLTNGGAPQTLTVPVGGGSPTFQSGNLIFYGFISDSETFTRIDFNNTGGSNDIWGFDDMTIGDPGQVIPPTNGAVPEPGSLAIFAALGLVGFAGARRRKKNKTA